MLWCPSAWEATASKHLCFRLGSETLLPHVTVTASFSFDLRHYFMLAHPPFFSFSPPHHHTDGIRTQMALISDSCPEKVWRQVPSRTSHSLAVASQAPEMNSLKSGETAKLIQSPVWPRNTVFCCPVSMSQSALWQRRELLRARTTLISWEEELSYSQTGGGKSQTWLPRGKMDENIQKEIC